MMARFMSASVVRGESHSGSFSGSGERPSSTRLRGTRPGQGAQALGGDPPGAARGHHHIHGVQVRRPFRKGGGFQGKRPSMFPVKADLHRPRLDQFLNDRFGDALGVVPTRRDIDGVTADRRPFDGGGFHQARKAALEKAPQHRRP